MLVVLVAVAELAGACVQTSRATWQRRQAPAAACAPPRQNTAATRSSVASYTLSSSKLHPQAGHGPRRAEVFSKHGKRAALFN